MSDANYKKVELDGPSIEQVVHPLAAAEFVGAAGAGRSKRRVNSCSGGTVDVEVDLRVSFFWFGLVVCVGIARDLNSCDLCRGRDRGTSMSRSLDLRAHRRY